MTISIKLEPKDYQEMPREDCYFCNSPTRYWHLGTNNPICPLCSRFHKVKELPNRFKGE